MLSVATATKLLQCAANPGRLADVATELRFEKRSEELTPLLRERLSLPIEVTRARVSRGPGALRGLIVELAAEAPQRDVITRAAAALCTNAPHSLWLILGCIRNGASAFLAAPTIRNGRAHVRALTVDRHHVYATDAETLCALSAACDAPDILVHTRWVEILGRDALTRRFYVALRGVVREVADALPRIAPRPVAGELALLNVSRLLFLAFLQSRGWLNGDHAFLQNAYESGIEAGGRVHATVLEPLFFGTLNTRPSHRQPRARAFGRIPYLNGGLFARTPTERKYRGIRLPDEALGRVVGELLSRYRFTPREELAEWSDAAVDPVILGRAFESLMDHQNRKASGTYYTPPEIVERATRLALERALVGPDVPEDAVAAALDGHAVPADTARGLLARVRAFRILDPACGSGAFLIHALRVLARLREQLGSETHSEARRAVLTGSIFGVDVNPTAVWLCELRLWLSLAVECRATDPLAVPRLPNLDRNIRVGDSLTGPAIQESIITSRSATLLTVLRTRYSRAEGQRKRTLARSLDVAERNAALAVLDARLTTLRSKRRDLILAARSHDLFGERRAGAHAAEELHRLRAATRAARAERERIKCGAALAFSFPVHFADAIQSGGFDAIVGNPPWVRPHRLPVAARAALRARFRVCRAGTFAPDERQTGPLRTFGAQVDLAAPFVERSLELLRPGGALALLVPAKLWSSLSGAGLRWLVRSAGELLAIEDFTDSGRLFDAATYPSLVGVAKRNGDVPGPTPLARVAVHRRSTRIEWQHGTEELGLNGGPAAPWLLIPPHVRRAFDRLRAAGPPLAESRFGAPRLGVKTGCNAGFIVRVAACGSTLAEVRSDERQGWIEQSMLRPALRGELVKPWRVPPHNEHVVWTHDASDRPRERLPTHAAAWLRQWRRELLARTDSRPGGCWWQLFRTAAARCDRHRVVWSDIGRAPRACVLEPGDPTVPLNTCYVAFADEADAWALAALLNGPLASAWLNVLAEPARGGYKRYFAWTIGALPVPRDETAFREGLAPLGHAGHAGHEPSQSELLDAALAAYHVRKSDVAALMEWRDV